MRTVFAGRNNKITHYTNVRYPDNFSNQLLQLLKTYPLGIQNTGIEKANFGYMKQLFRCGQFILFSVLLFSCNQPDPQLQREAVFDICGCMGIKDALLIRDTLGLNQEIRMLHYAQCIFDHANQADPFDPSFRKIIESTCKQILPLHDAFVEAGTKKEKAVN